MAAAVALFEAETAAPAGDGAPEVSPWQRAALLEGVSAKEIVQRLEGGEQWLS